MPLYEYVCRECGYKFDVLRTIKEADSPIHCKNCDSEQTRRMLSLCFSNSDGRAVAGSNSGGCAGCGGGSCAHCGH